jgi:hypothetical protein
VAIDLLSHNIRLLAQCDAALARFAKTSNAYAALVELKTKLKSSSK